MPCLPSRRSVPPVLRHVIAGLGGQSRPRGSRVRRLTPRQHPLAFCFLGFLRQQLHMARDVKTQESEAHASGCLRNTWHLSRFLGFHRPGGKLSYDLAEATGIIINWEGPT